MNEEWDRDDDECEVGYSFLAFAAGMMLGVAVNMLGALIAGPVTRWLWAACALVSWCAVVVVLASEAW